MKRIRRFQGPVPGLAEYGKQAGAQTSWNGYRGRGAGRRRYRELVETLAGLQHGLCGYCEIDLREGDLQVEHVVPTSAGGQARALDAANMIACCRGGASDDPGVRGDRERFSPPQGSCGHAEGDTADPDFVDPRTAPDLPSLTRVRPNGRIEADRGACAAAGRSADGVEKTIRILGLNVQRLRTARREYWETLSGKMPAYRGDSNAARDWARSRLLPQNGALPKFFTVSRSYFGALGEQILAQRPRNWI